MSTERVEFKVTWFPPGEKTRTRTFVGEGSTEAASLRAAETFCEVVHDALPILERRVIVVKEWEIVRNYADLPQSNS